MICVEIKISFILRLLEEVMLISNLMWLDDFK